MSAHDDLDKQLNAYLLEGPTELPDPSFDAVRDRTEHTRQRLILGPWKLPELNRFLAVGIGTAALVVVVLLIGANLVGSLTPAPGGEGLESAPPSQAAPSAESSSSLARPLAEGPVVWIDPTRAGWSTPGPSITVTIPAPGWTLFSDSLGLMKGDGGTDPMEAAMLSWSTTGGFYVYGDPCHWEDSRPDEPVTTVDALVAALAAQPTRNASEPVDVTVGGHDGKQITLYVPNDAPTRAEAFADCDGRTFASFAEAGPNHTQPTRWHQGPGQVDEFWILDVDGALVVIDAFYRIDSGDLPDTPPELIEEMRSIAESATFDAP